MEDRAVQFYVGFMMVAAMLVGAILLVLIGEWPTFARRTYPVHVRFDEAPRVTADTPVRKSGLLIGYVEEVTFAEDDPSRPDDHGVVARLAIFRDVKVRRGELFQVDATLLGDATIQVVPGARVDLEADYLAPGDYVADGRVRPDAFEALENLQRELPQIVDRVGGAADRLGLLAEDLSRLLRGNEPQLSRIVQKTEQAIDSFHSAMDGADSLFNDPQLREDLQRTFAETPRILAETRDTLTAMRRTLELADTNLESLQNFTVPLGERGETIVSQVEDATEQINILLSEVTDLVRGVRNPDGTVGLLLRRPDVYHSVNRAAANIAELTEQLKPILYDLRVFSDKISRHPGIIVREAIQPRSGIK